MLKYLTLIVTIFVCMGFNAEAEALVKQSASNALSYRNVVNGTSSVTSGRNNNMDVLANAPQSVDIQNSVSKSISTSPDEEFEVLLPEKAGYSWKISYDNDQLIMTGNVADGGARKVKFMQKGTGDSTVFFDNVNSEGKITQNKAVYIKAH